MHAWADPFDEENNWSCPPHCSAVQCQWHASDASQNLGYHLNELHEILGQNIVDINQNPQYLPTYPWAFQAMIDA